MEGISRASLQGLPTELIQDILEWDAIDAVDAFNLAATCRRLRDVVHGVKGLWKRKFRLRLPLFSAFSSDAVYSISLPQPDPYDDALFKHLIQSHPPLERQIRTTLNRFAVDFYNKLSLDDADFRELTAPFESNPFSETITLAVLQSIVSDSSDLTLKLYATEALTFLKQRALGRCVELTMDIAAADGDFVLFSVLLCQWCRPAEKLWAKDTMDFVETTADRILEQVLSNNPRHPLSSGGSDVSFIEGDAGKVVLDTLNRVFFNELNFQGDDQDYYNIDNSFIDRVIARRKGIPITMSILYATLGRRLRLRLLPVNFPRHFILRWKRSAETDYFIDVFDGGRLLDKDRVCPPPHDSNESQERLRLLDPCDPRDVFTRQLNNVFSVLKDAEENPAWDRLTERVDELRLKELNLLLISDPELLNVERLQLAFNYCHAARNYTRWEELFKIVTDAGLMGNPDFFLTFIHSRYDRKDSYAPPPPKLRADYPGVSFRVGQVIWHRRYNYSAVISGWDPTCQQSESWVKQMGVDRLEHTTEQPFYHVLVEDGSTRYCAQENAGPQPIPHTIPHPAIGRFFSSFQPDRGYELNSASRLAYPDD